MAKMAIRLVVRVGCAAGRSLARMNRSPVINYTYAHTRPIIERMLRIGAGSRQAPWRARALRQSDQWRAGSARRRTPTSRCSRRASKARNPSNRRRGLRLCGRSWHHRCERRIPRVSTDGVFVVPASRAVEGLRPHRRERLGAVLDLRPSFPGGARDLARRHTACRWASTPH